MAKHAHQNQNTHIKIKQVISKLLKSTPSTQHQEWYTIDQWEGKMTKKVYKEYRSKFVWLERQVKILRAQQLNYVSMFLFPNE